MVFYPTIKDNKTWIQKMEHLVLHFMINGSVGKYGFHALAFTRTIIPIIKSTEKSIVFVIEQIICP